MTGSRNLPALAVIAAALAACVLLVSMIASAGGTAGTELVEDAVRRAALTCYAVEGAYPPGLEYLRENYGLAYDEEQYFVIYDAFASNLMPEIRVRQRGE